MGGSRAGASLKQGLSDGLLRRRLGRLSSTHGRGRASRQNILCGLRDADSSTQTRSTWIICTLTYPAVYPATSLVGKLGLDSAHDKPFRARR
jgi:hypothetical protein